jgi:phosphate-selective porin
LGIYWRINPALRLTAYYDIVRNETTENLKDQKNDKGVITSYGYEGSDRKADVFTLRLQYKF